MTRYFKDIDPHLLEVRFILERLFKQTIRIKYDTNLLDFTEQFIIYLDNSKEHIRISIPLPYEPLKLDSYVRTHYPEYFL